MNNKAAYTKYNSTGIKQKYDIYDYNNGLEICSILVALNNKGTLRIRYPVKNQLQTKYLRKASRDLTCLSVLMIAGLVTPGMFADKLQEEFPQFEDAANLLRKWENIKINGR